MDIQIHEDLAAFGVFHLVYSALDERLTSAVQRFALAAGEQKRLQEVRHRMLPEDADQASQMKFGQKVDYLKKAIRPLKAERGAHSLSHDLAAMHKAFQNIKDVQKWRNDRAHARVAFSSHLTLVNAKGKPLTIKYEDCAKQIKKASVVRHK